MKTKRFCELIERAMAEEYGESNFDTVPYLPEGEGAVQSECLGIFLLEGVHMAVVAARAQYLLWQDMNAFNGANEPEDEIDEAMGDFCDIMGSMRVAPYMQWHCAYFPGLTEEQVLGSGESGQEMVLDMSGTGIERDNGSPITLELPDTLTEEARMVIERVVAILDICLDTAQITKRQHDRAITYIERNSSLVATKAIDLSEDDAANHVIEFLAQNQE